MQLSSLSSYINSHPSTLMMSRPLPSSDAVKSRRTKLQILTVSSYLHSQLMLACNITSLMLTPLKGNGAFPATNLDLILLSIILSIKSFQICLNLGTRSKPKQTLKLMSLQISRLQMSPKILKKGDICGDILQCFYSRQCLLDNV